MKFGLRYCNTGRYVDPANAVQLLEAGEEAGFESAWTVEHTVVPTGYESSYPYSADGKMANGQNDIPLPDPLIWMAYAAACTTKIKLATGILILPQHSPVITAKQIATLDHMSNGRVLLGIGVGWLREEFEAIGVPFDDRGRRTDEYVAVMRELWSRRLAHLPRRVHKLRRCHLPPAAEGRRSADYRRRSFKGCRPPRRPLGRWLLSRRATLHRK